MKSIRIKLLQFSKYLLAVVAFLSINADLAYSQSGLKFPELAQKLEPYFSADMINDIKQELPQGTDYSIWGWDVGDFSGDGYKDVAISVKLRAEKKRILQVYMFVDIDGFFIKVGQFAYEYIDLPLEIGVVIRSNICYATKKYKEYNWLLRGYSFDNGTLVLHDDFTTTRINTLTYEKSVNYKQSKNTRKYLKTNTNEVKFFADYLSIPSYSRGRMVYKGYPEEVNVNFIDYVYKGAYWWKGEDDASFTIKSRYDAEFLYMTVDVNDDKIATSYCDICYSDYLELWIDALEPFSRDDRLIDNSDGKEIRIRPQAEKGIFSVKVYPGDFYNTKAFVKEIRSTDELYKSQKDAASLIKIVSTLKSNGYIVKFKIPFKVFGYDGPPFKDDEITELGCTLVLHDLDNEFRPEESTEMSTSLFNSSEPSSYGSIMLIPDGKWFGESTNIYKEDILHSLKEMGF